MIRDRERRNAHLTADVRMDPEGPGRSAQITNVSTRGLRLRRAGRRLRRDQELWIEIPRVYGRGRMGMVARVAWTREDEAGVQIEAMLPHHRERLLSLFEALDRTEG